MSCAYIFIAMGLSEVPENGILYMSKLTSLL